MVYTLYYFDVRGRAEPIRLLFHYSNTPFNDVRIAKQDWRAKKQSFPFGQLPVLEIDKQTKLAESYSIARFLAIKFGLAGSSDFEAAYIDSVADLYKDFINKVGPYLHRKPTADKEALKRDIFEPAVHRFLPLFDDLLSKSSSGFIASTVSWADFFLAEGILSLKNTEPECLQSHPTLIKHQKAVHLLPQLKGYIDKRPYSQF